MIWGTYLPNGFVCTIPIGIPLPKCHKSRIKIATGPIGSINKKMIYCIGTRFEFGVLKTASKLRLGSFVSRVSLVKKVVLKISLNAAPLWDISFKKFGFVCVSIFG